MGLIFPAPRWQSLVTMACGLNFSTSQKPTNWPILPTTPSALEFLGQRETCCLVQGIDAVHTLGFLGYGRSR